MDPSQHEPTRAQNLSPIQPGTLCLIVQGPGRTVYQQHVGRTVTANRPLDGVCPCCGEVLYIVSAPWIRTLGVISRVCLKPILPPGIDDQIEGTVDDRVDLEVA